MNYKRKTRTIFLFVATILAIFATFMPTIHVYADPTTNNSGQTNQPNSNGSTNNNSNNNNGSNANTTNNATSAETLFKGRTLGNCGNILGMTPWDCGVTITRDQETLKQGVWIIATNIATDITILAAYLALGYVVYGGYLYTFSAGEPSKSAAGKKALSQAFIGLAITMSATAIMSTIRTVLIGAHAQPMVDCVTEGCVDPGALFLNTLHWFIGMAGIVSAIFVVYGGISYSTSSGSAEKIRKSKTMITNALIGLAIVALAEIITAFVSNIIREANTGSTQPQTTGSIDSVPHKRNTDNTTTFAYYRPTESKPIIRKSGNE